MQPANNITATTAAIIINNYKHIAYQKLGVAPAAWQASNGFKHNQVILHKVYLYYQQMALAEPKFIWMGLARLTGGQVLWGMGNLVKIAKDPCAITIHIVQIAIDIFDKLAWQHELYLHKPALLLHVLEAWEHNATSTYKFTDIWYKIAYGTENEIATANYNLLHNEQLNTVQNHYDIIRQDAYSRKFLLLTRFTMRNIHPYHKYFIVTVPFKDVTIFKYRWQWINAPNGMWASWIAIGEKERLRLISLSNLQIIKHEWQ